MKRFGRVFALTVGALVVVPVVAAGHPAPGGGALVPPSQWLMQRPDPPAAKHKPMPMRPNRGVDVLAHHNPGGFNADVVAHRGFAYMGSWGTSSDDDSLCPAQGVRVYDLKNLRRLNVTATFADGESNPLLDGSWTEKVQVHRVNTPHFKGDLAAVSFQSCKDGGFGGIGLYDVTNPRHPTELALFENGTIGVHELWLQVRKNRAYVYQATIFEEIFQWFGGATEPGNPDFRVIDVSDPRNPQQVGQWSAWEEFGINPGQANGSFAFNLVHSMIGDDDGDRAYLSYWDFGTVILDMTDPTDPQFLGRTTFAANQEGNAHSSWLARGGRLLIETQEDFDGDPFPGIETGFGYTRFFDISDEESPREIAQFRMPSQPAAPGPGDWTVHDPKVQGSKLFLSHYAEGVVTLDISRPTQPRQTAQFLPPPTGDPFGYWFDGVPAPNVWGVWLEGKYVLASDINSGLWVYKLRGRDDDDDD
jgi:hypothetical protein